MVGCVEWYEICIAIKKILLKKMMFLKQVKNIVVEIMIVIYSVVGEDALNFYDLHPF